MYTSNLWSRIPMQKCHCPKEVTRRSELMWPGVTFLMSCSYLLSNSIVHIARDNGIMLVLSPCTPYSTPILAYLYTLGRSMLEMLQENVCVVSVQSEPWAGESLLWAEFVGLGLPSALILLSNGYFLLVWLLTSILNNVLGHLLRLPSLCPWALFPDVLGQFSWLPWLPPSKGSTWHNQNWVTICVFKLLVPWLLFSTPSLPYVSHFPGDDEEQSVLHTTLHFSL